MALNQKREDGRHLHVVPTNGAATSGAPGRYGQRPGVAEEDLDGDGACTMDFGGVYELSVKGVDGSGNSAVAAGDEIFYVDGDTPKLSKKATGRHFGWAHGTVTSGGTSTIDVKVGWD
jgi:hypothetical protein